MTLPSLIKNHLKPFYPSFGLILLLTTASILTQLATPWPFQMLLDYVLGNEPLPPDSLLQPIFEYLATPYLIGMFVVLLYFVINLLANLVSALESFYSNRVMRRLIHSFSQRIFAQAQVFDLGFYRTKEVGDYLYRIAYDASSIGVYVEFGILPLISSSLYLILATIILASIDPRLTLVTLISLPILTFCLYHFNRRIVQASKHSEEQNSSLHSFIQQNLSQLKIIQAYRQERSQVSHYSQKLDASLDADFTVNNLNVFLSLVIGIIITLTYTLIIGLGVYLVFAGTLTTGLLIVFIFYLDHLTQPTLKIVDAVTTLKEEAVRLARLAEFFEPQAQVQDTGAITTLEHTGIQFIQVTLKDSTGKPILDRVSCSIPEKRLTVIIGMSGSGKSTLTSLIMRLINEPDDGAITIGAYHTRDYRLDVLRNNIALVPQEIELFNDSIYNLITFGDPQVDLASVRHATQLAIAEDFILKHPGGYQFRVGERGENLSGGQRQRISLARAYLKNAPIMIIDEIFAFQDPQTKAEMLKNLRSFAYGKTVIMVTNTFDVIEPNDHVILIHQGKIAYQGAFNQMKTSTAMLQLLDHTPTSGKEVA